MIGIKVTVRVDGIVSALHLLSKPNKAAVFKELRGPARFDQHHHDRREEGPEGRWPALAPSTIARNRYIRSKKGTKVKSRPGQRRRKPKPGRKLLLRLPRAVESITSAHSLVIRSRVRRGLGLIHQQGGRAGHGSRIPQRQYLWISDWLREKARAAFQAALVAAWKASP